MRKLPPLNTLWVFLQFCLSLYNLLFFPLCFRILNILFWGKVEYCMIYVALICVLEFLLPLLLFATWITFLRQDALEEELEVVRNSVDNLQNKLRMVWIQFSSKIGFVGYWIFGCLFTFFFLLVHRAWKLKTIWRRKLVNWKSRK